MGGRCGPAEAAPDLAGAACDSSSLAPSSRRPRAAAARTITLSGRPRPRAAGRRPRVLLPARGAQRAAVLDRRRRHRDRVADAARGIVDAGLTEPRAPARATRRGLVFTPIALSAVCLVTNPATRCRTSRAPSSRTSWRRARRVGRSFRARRAPTRSSPVGYDVSAAAHVFLSIFVDLETPLAYRPRTFTTAAQVRDFIAVDARGRGLSRPRVHAPACTRSPTRASRARARRSSPAPIRRAARSGFVTRGRAARRARALPALDRARRHREAGDRDALRRARS